MISEKLLAKQKEMRQVAAFTKYCADCGETFGSDDIEEFMKMLPKHECGA